MPEAAFNPAFLGFLLSPVARVFGPNDSSINRGDREDAGDNEAAPDDLGSGSAIPTMDPTSLGGNSSINQPPAGGFNIDQEREDNDGIEIMRPDDGRLGVTNFGDVPEDDWAADTGETRTGESNR